MSYFIEINSVVQLKQLQYLNFPYLINITGIRLKLRYLEKRLKQVINNVVTFNNYRALDNQNRQENVNFKENNKLTKKTHILKSSTKLN